MSLLDPPAAAARRQHALDRITEDLVGWGCPLESAPDRARQLLDHALAAGYRLPEVLTDAPHRHGGGSTDQGRARARRAYEQARAGCRCGPDRLGLLPEWHPVGCPVRDAHDRGTTP